MTNIRPRPWKPNIIWNLLQKFGLPPFISYTLNNIIFVTFVDGSRDKHHPDNPLNRIQTQILKLLVTGQLTIGFTE